MGRSSPTGEREVMAEQSSQDVRLHQLLKFREDVSRALGFQYCGSDQVLLDYIRNLKQDQEEALSLLLRVLNAQDGTDDIYDVTRAIKKYIDGE